MCQYDLRGSRVSCRIVGISFDLTVGMRGCVVASGLSFGRPYNATSRSRSSSQYRGEIDYVVRHMILCSDICCPRPASARGTHPARQPELSPIPHRVSNICCTRPRGSSRRIFVVQTKSELNESPIAQKSREKTILSRASGYR